MSRGFCDIPPLLVMAAVHAELELLVGSLADRRELVHPAWPVITGRLAGALVVCCAAGPGAANAAGATAALIERYQPRLVLITGCGGALAGSGLAIGDLAIASEELFADLGVMTQEGWLDLQEMGLPLAVTAGQTLYNRLPLTPQPLEQALHCARSLGLKLFKGSFATVAACSGTSARGEELVKRYGVICENMEGAATALICLRYSIPCLEIRGISNLVEERDRSRWDIPAALLAAQRFVISFLEQFQRDAS